MECKLANSSVCDLNKAFKSERNCICRWTPLHAAIAANLEGSKFMHRIQILAGYKLDVNILEGSQLTPCMFAVECNATDSLTQLLIMGADSSIRGVHDLSALDLAVLLGNKDAARICLNSGNHPTRPKCTGGVVWNPVKLACWSNHPELVDLLLDYRQNLTCKHHASGQSLLDIACIMGHHRVLEILLSYVVQEDVGSCERSIFQLIRVHPFTASHLECFHIFLKQCSADVEDSDGLDILQNLVNYKNYPCIEHLLGLERFRSKLLNYMQSCFGGKSADVAYLSTGDTGANAPWILFHSLKMFGSKGYDKVEQIFRSLSLPLIHKQALDNCTRWIRAPDYISQRDNNINVLESRTQQLVDTLQCHSTAPMPLPTPSDMQEMQCHIVPSPSPHIIPSDGEGHVCTTFSDSSNEVSTDTKIHAAEGECDHNRDHLIEEEGECGNLGSMQDGVLRELPAPEESGSNCECYDVECVECNREGENIEAHARSKYRKLFKWCVS